MTVTFVPYSAPGADGHLWRWPDACQRDPERFTLELNHRNAANVLAGRTVPAQQVRRAGHARVAAELRDALPYPVPRSTSSPSARITFTEGRWTDDHIEQRLYDLAMHRERRAILPTIPRSQENFTLAQPLREPAYATASDKHSHVAASGWSPSAAGGQVVV